MKKNFLLTQLMTVTLASFLLFACKKEKSESLSPGQEEQAANYNTESETENEVVFNDVFDNVMGVNNEVGVGGTGIFGRRTADGTMGRGMNADTIPSCLKVTITRLNLPEPFPVKIVLDFGNGCPGPDGHIRYGKIITVYSGKLIIPGRSAITTFDGFKVDSISVEGTHKITNTTAPGSNKAQFTVEVTDARLTHPNGNYSIWSNQRIITQVEGNGTVMPADDIFSIQGSAHGRVKKGNDLFAWQSEITEPLRKKYACHWISKGIIRIRRETLSTTSPWVAILNYGNGDCDYLATLTINGITHQIQLPH